jgi:hypothetical protein
MLSDLSALKDFLDLGGTFILALVIIYCWFKSLRSIDEKLVQVLTLLAILTKTNTNFNGVDKVLDKNFSKVAETILQAEAEHSPSL